MTQLDLTTDYAREKRKNKTIREKGQRFSDFTKKKKKTVMAFEI